MIKIRNKARAFITLPNGKPFFINATLEVTKKEFEDFLDNPSFKRAIEKGEIVFQEVKYGNKGK